MPNIQKSFLVAAVFWAASLSVSALVALAPVAANAQSNSTASRTNTSQQGSEQAARASWTPTRRGAVRSNQQAGSTPQRTTQSRALQNSNVQRRSASPQVQQASHQSPGVPTPPPMMEGGIVYQGAVADGSCDALGVSCGCDAMGCDSMGACGPSCGCATCGEVPSGRAWRPAITLSLPQDGWFSIEGIGAWQDGMNLPPLLTTSPANTPRDDAGVLGRPGTRVLVGSEPVLDDSFEGARIDFGIWLDRCHTFGVGGELFELDEQAVRRSITSTGDPILARPFFNTLTGSNDSGLIAYPGTVSGTATLGITSRLSGAAVYFRQLRQCDEGCRDWLFCGCNGHYCTRSEFRFGYRYMQLDEAVGIREETVSNDTANPGTLNISDAFQTTNQFNGIEFGWSRRLVRGYWNLDGMIRLGVGNTRQQVLIRGSTVVNDTINPPETFDEGILALESNSGRHEQDQFSVIPEFRVTAGYQLTEHLKATLGYTGIYWSNVVRPGEHISLDVNPDYLPPEVVDPQGEPRPRFAFDTIDYWAQGITYGLEYRW